MATQKQSNRQDAFSSRGAIRNDVDLGVSVGADLATKDANRFLVGLVVMALVFALLLPLTVIMYIDILSVRATIRAEAKELRKLKEELKKEKQ